MSQTPIRRLLMTILKGTAVMSPWISVASGSIHSLCWRGSSEYEYELVYCDSQDARDDDMMWYCYKSVVCQDWANKERTCPVIKGCATTSNCTLDDGSVMDGDSQTAGALTIRTWCSPAETSLDFATGLSLRDPTNAAPISVSGVLRSAGGWASLALLSLAVVCVLF